MQCSYTYIYHCGTRKLWDFTRVIVHSHCVMLHGDRNVPKLWIHEWWMVEYWQVNWRWSHLTFEVLQYFSSYCWPFWKTSYGQQGRFAITDRLRSFCRKHVSVVVSSVPVNSLTPSGTRSFAGSVASRFNLRIYSGLVLEKVTYVGGTSKPG